MTYPLEQYVFSVGALYLCASGALVGGYSLKKLVVSRTYITGEELMTCLGYAGLLVWIPLLLGVGSWLISVGYMTILKFLAGER